MNGEAAPVLSDFSGRLLCLYLKNPGEREAHGVVVEFPELEPDGAGWRLVGRLPGLDGSSVVSRRRIEVAWDSVLYYLVFESREDYAARLLRKR